MAIDCIDEQSQYPFRLELGGDLTAIRDAFEANGYTQPALSQTIIRHDGSGRLDTTTLQRRTAPPTTYNSLVRLFYLGEVVPMELARRTLEPVGVERLIDVGLLQLREGGVRSQAMLIPYEDAVVVQDFPAEIAGRPDATNYVLGVGRASITLAGLTVRRHGELVLDMGTGSGYQAFVAARHAAKVIATDINPRALNFAALGARINGLSNVELRQGSLYEPVAGEQFDLLITNPPFVISPESRYLYRDSGLPGDVLSEQVIRGAPARLREGGYAIVLYNWHHGEEDWAERPRQWVIASGCDAWLLCFQTHDPLTYAATWLRSTAGHDPASYSELLDAWMRYYEQLGIQRISYGAAILRKRSGRVNWIRADTVPSGQGMGSCSTQIQRIFAALDLLEDLEDERHLLDHALVLAPEHQMEHVLKAEGGGWTVKEAVLKLEEGLQFTGRVDRLVSVVLAGCDGHHPLRELVTDVAQGLSVDFEAVAPSCLAVVRKLMQTGFLGIAARP